jgi:hypothetical protein
VVDNPCNLVGKQPRIDGVVNRSYPHDAVPDFEMAPRVAGERSHTVSEANPVPIKALRNLQRSPPQCGVSRGVDRAFDRTRHDLPFGMVAGCVINDAMAEQRPILHQSKHDIPSGIR